MTPTLTDARLAELEAIAAKATPGQREVSKRYSNCCECPPEIWIKTAIGSDWIATMTGAPYLGFDPYPNAEQFAAFDRETCLALVAELRATRQATAAVRDILTKAATWSNEHRVVALLNDALAQLAATEGDER